MADHNYVDLAVVEEYNTRARYVVQCNGFEAHVGAIVEFEVEKCFNLGEVVRKLTVANGDDEWNFINDAIGITPFVRIWNRGGNCNEAS